MFNGTKEKQKNKLQDVAERRVRKRRAAKLSNTKRYLPFIGSVGNKSVKLNLPKGLCLCRNNHLVFL